jgi:hypothetical protein
MSVNTSLVAPSAPEATGTRRATTLLILFLLVTTAIMTIRYAAGKFSSKTDAAPAPVATPVNIRIADAVVPMVAVTNPATSAIRAPAVDHDPPSKKGWWLVRMNFLDDVLSCIFNAKERRLGECKPLSEEWRVYMTDRNKWAIADKEMQMEMAQAENDQ